jgi:hypothetical protein
VLLRTFATAGSSAALATLEAVVAELYLSGLVFIMDILIRMFKRID